MELSNVRNRNFLLTKLHLCCKKSCKILQDAYVIENIMKLDIR